MLHKNKTEYKFIYLFKHNYMIITLKLIIPINILANSIFYNILFFYSFSLFIQQYFLLFVPFDVTDVLKDVYFPVFTVFAELLDALFAGL